MEERQNYLFGMHPVLEAIADDRKIEKVLFKKGMDGPLFREMLEKLQEKEIPFQFFCHLLSLPILDAFQTDSFVSLPF